MSFSVSAEAYGRFMGRFSEPLADSFVDLLNPQRGSTALDVGCGPGALTGRLVAALGDEAVTAVDPMPEFLEALRSRWPGVRALRGSAEELPLADDVVDLAVAQLVVHFMKDPVAGLGEMRRVTRPAGTVAATVWDLAGDTSPLSDFWAGAVAVDPTVTTEAWMPGARAGHLAALFDQAGFADARTTTLTVTVSFSSFEEWWEPFTFGVGPAGAYVASLDEPGQERLRESCRTHLPDAPFQVTGQAWTVVARA